MANNIPKLLIDIHAGKITDHKLQTRVNYLDNCYGKNYNKIQFFDDDNENISILMYNETDDQIVSDVALVFPDGKVLTPALPRGRLWIQNRALGKYDRRI